MNYQDEHGQWVIDGHIVAGAATEQDAINLIAEARQAPTLVEIKQGLKERINIDREQRLMELTVDLDGVTYDADAPARENINSVVSAISAGVTVANPTNWRAANNTTQSLSHAKLVELSGLMLAAVQGIYETSWTLKANIDAAADEPAALAVTWQE